MRIDRADAEVIDVTLSRRNLLAVLAKLDGHPPGSACTISWPGAEGQPMLFVRAEPDEHHYANRAPAGPMAPATEAALRREEERPRDAARELIERVVEDHAEVLEQLGDGPARLADLKPCGPERPRTAGLGSKDNSMTICPTLASADDDADQADIHASAYAEAVYGPAASVPDDEGRVFDSVEDFAAYIDSIRSGCGEEQRRADRRPGLR